ncbi:hypothetical protein BGW39_006573 [Mortierella sp. 14UC]|nr:hypothetical protein BGW39_006573 [Mortierella sp. 14UC]
MSAVSSPPPPPELNNDTKPKRSVSFMKHATVTVNEDDSNTIMVPTGAPGNVHRSSFRPGRRPGYVRKGPVQSDSEADEESDEDIRKEDEDEESGDEKANEANGSGSFSPQWNSTPQQQATTTTAPGATMGTTGKVVRPGRGQNYVRRAPVNSDTESDEERLDEPTRSSTTTTSASSYSINKKVDNDEDENSDTDEDHKNGGGGVGGLMRPMAQTRISGPGQNYVRRAPVNSDSEDQDDESDDDSNRKKQQMNSTPHAASLPAVNSPAPQQPPHSGGSIHNRHLNTVLGATTPGSGGGVPGSGPHSRTASFDPYFAAAGMVAGVGGSSSALSSPRSAPFATSSPAAAQGYNPYTPPASVGMTINSNCSNSSLGNLSNLSGNNGSNPHLASASPASSTIAAATLANSMAIYQQQQQEMMMIMQQQQLQIATMQQQQQAYQLLVLQQQQQHQQQLHAVHQQHSRAASANGSVHALESFNNNNNKVAGASDSDDDVPLGDKQNQLPQLPALPQFSSLLDDSSPPPPSTTTITPASPTTAHAHAHYSPRLSVQQSPLINHNRQVSSSSIHSLNNGVGGAYLHQPISSSPLNPATSNAAASSSTLLGQHQVYSGAHTHHQTSSQPRLSDFIEEEQDRLLREQHLQATAAALGGHSVPSSSAVGYNGGASLLTSSFPAGYRGSVASVMSLQQSPGIDRGSMNSLHSAGSSGSSGSNGNGNGGAGGQQHRPTHVRDSFIPVMATTLIQQQQYLTQQPHLLHQQQQQPYLPYQQPSTLIHVEAKPPPPSAGLVGAISAMERDKKLAKAHGTNQLQFQHQQAQQQMMMNVEKERWLQEQRRLAWEAGQFPQQQLQQQQQQVQFQQGHGQQQMYYQQPGMMMQVPMMQQHQQAWTCADEEDDDRPLGTH